MTKNDFIAKQALKIDRLEQEIERLARGPAEQSAARCMDPRGRHPHKWEEIKRLQAEQAEINAAATREAKARTDQIQARINDIWQEMQAA